MNNRIVCAVTLVRFWAATAVAMIAFLIMPGCGRSGLDLQMVEGVVTINGEPLAGATVGFSPLIPGQGLPATGATVADGTFRLTATRGGTPDKGTTVGDYAVTISKVELLPDPLWDNLKPGETPSRPRQMQYRYVVPKAYESITTSGLKATVKKGVNKGDAFRYDLKSDYKPE